jgi:hypothetical protein
MSRPGVTGTSVPATLAARRAAIRNDLTPDERTALEGIRDRLTAALASIQVALGDETATNATTALSALSALYRGHARNDLDDEQRKALESARDDVTSALTDVHTLLGETNAAARLKASQFESVGDLYARRNTPRKESRR